MNRAVKQCLLAFNVVLADPDTQRALNFTEFLYLEHSKDNIPGIRTSGNLYGLLPSMSIMEFT